MNVHQASGAWQQRQAKAIRSAYERAWKAGQASYRTQAATPPAPATAQPPPKTPPPGPMRQALAPALNSLARMGAELALLVPTAAQIAEAGTLVAATVLLVKAWLRRNAYRLAGAASVAWAGEQHGYTQAADAAGLLLEWELDGAANHCDDCIDLAGLPPMPLDQWPTLPGDGATRCAAGCKCSMRAIASAAVPLTALQAGVTARIAARQPEPIAA